MHSLVTKMKGFLRRNPRFKKVIGVLCIVVGFVSLVTPFTPGSWLIFIGLELFGIRFLFWKKIKRWLEERRNKN